MINARTACIASLLLSLLVIWVRAAEPEERRPIMEAVPDPSDSDDGACSFSSKQERGIVPVNPVALGANLECELLVKVDGRPARLRSSQPGACERGWGLPNKGARFSRTHSDGVTSIRADYLVTDLCWVGDRCEYIEFDATFHVTTSGGTTIVRAAGRCSW